MALDLSRWPDADALLDEALGLPPESRRAFLRRATSDDALLAALERVLDEAHETDAFLPPGGALSGPLADLLRGEAGGDGSPRLEPGDVLGPYRIVSWLGRGGMGEVYRAEDGSLGREVALKLLPAEVADDPVRHARFRREARLLASLNHPNIGAIYHVIDEGHVLALVLELVEGPTLADRLRAGPLPLSEALPLARQIGDAVAAAFQAGVVHRDLKPANIKVTPAGIVKVLDFGIAKAITTVTGRSDGHSSLTHSHAGGALGTAAYMSPEQARGEEVDHRTDVWAFSCVLYEMLTGRRAFEGQSATEVLARVLERDPDFARLPADTPEPIHRLLRRGLQKDPRQRLGVIGDALLELNDAVTAPAGSSAVPPVAERAARWRWLWPLGAAAGGAALALLVVKLATTPEPPMRLAVPIPAGHEVVVGQSPALAIARDGQQLVYRARERGVIRLYRRSLHESDAVGLEGTEDAAGQALSPDGQFVAFLQGGVLYKMPVAGGAPAALTPAPGGGSIAWGTPETIVFSVGPGAPLRRVSASGGASEAATTFDAAAGDESHNWPQLLADGRTLLFTISAAGTHHLAVATLGSGEPPTRLTMGRQPRLLPSGLLVFARDRGLWAAQFDTASRRLTSEPRPVLDNVDRSAINGFVHFDVSDSGDLVYMPFRERAGLRTVQWMDRTGQPLATEIERRGITRVALSPDEARLALAIADDGDRDIWVVDRGRGATVRLTAEGGIDTQPVWSPDSRTIAYRADHEGGGVFVRSADGASSPRRLSSSGNATDIPYAFTHDGSRVLFTRFRDYSDQDVLSVPVSGGTVETLLADPHAETRPAVSPDGRWLLYQSDHSGRYEVYLRPFPNVSSGMWPVSTGGGTSAIWRKDGAEILFAEGRMLTAVSFVPGMPPTLGRPQALFDLGPTDNRLGPEFNTSADASRILVLRDADGSAERPEVRLVLRWTGTQ